MIALHQIKIIKVIIQINQMIKQKVKDKDPNLKNPIYTLKVEADQIQEKIIKDKGQIQEKIDITKETLQNVKEMIVWIIREKDQTQEEIVLDLIKRKIDIMSEETLQTHGGRMMTRIIDDQIQEMAALKKIMIALAKKRFKSKVQNRTRKFLEEKEVEAAINQ